MKRHLFATTCLSLWRVAAAAALPLSVACLVPAAAAAQGAGTNERPVPWPAITLGPRFGYDQGANGEVVGAQLRVPVLRSGRLEVMPNADITFLTGLREYDWNLEAVYVTGGRAGGVYLGGGLAFRNSIYGDDASSPRETLQGYSAVVGMKVATGDLFGSQVEFRWIFLPDADFDPRQVTLGINFALWGGSERRGGAAFGR